MVINSSNRMGTASAGNNRMLIACLPRRIDHNKIFDNAKALQRTQYSVSEQVPPAIDQRHQFTWVNFKKAKADKRPI